MLKGTGITKRFGGLQALNRVSFELRADEILGLIGPNGSGKTTLFNVISGFYRPEEGQLFFQDRKISGLAPHRIAKMGIGRTFQLVRPLIDMTLLDNVMIAVLYGRENINAIKPARDRAAEILEFVGLDHKRASKPPQLALEDRKRLEVARALGSKPSVLLLDEVFAGLNPREIHQAIDLTFRIRDSFGITIFMIEHVMKAIMEACSRIIALHYGTKIADGTPQEVANHPEVVKAYLGAEYVGN
jgi:branched-chain amino acid transport system ATP-binding protein